ncbi:MAG: tryptophan synthase subunit alpha [Acidobacteria bacterium]|nr:tryptophan synthase subunit alpha [Acidobacteriota bacterium]MBI3423572.1 tryptophan synthase subunit alpha [Acidobacteriota bacterium]
MTRISAKWQQLKAEGRKAFIPYITAGDPDLATTEALLLALADAGADIIELGVPFSDPMADGPVIQRASERALLKSLGVADILPMVERVRQHSQVPLMLFTYFNPLLQFTREGLGAKLKAAGLDGVLITDLIPEEADAFVAEMRGADIDTIFLAAPTSPDERLKLIAQYSSGFVYVVARTGVTGMRESVATEAHSLVERVRQYTPLPVAVGFGISKPEHVRDVWRYADGAVVGTRLVLEIENNLGAPDLVERVTQLVRELRQAY